MPWYGNPHKKIVIHEPDCPPPGGTQRVYAQRRRVNDDFLIDQLPDEFTFQIYNRWGEVVFGIRKKPGAGTARTAWVLPVSDGVYFYNLNAYDKDYHGFIHVFR